MNINEKKWIDFYNNMDINFGDMDPIDIRDISDALQQLVEEGLIECGLNEDGEFVFWMTDEQKARHDKGITDESIE